MLGPTPFKIFINDLYDGTECTLLKFANTQLERVADAPAGCAAVERHQDGWKNGPTAIL